MKHIPCKEKEPTLAVYSENADPEDVLELLYRSQATFREDPQPGKPGKRLKFISTGDLDADRKLIKKGIKAGKKLKKKLKKKNKLAEVILLQREIESLEKQL